MPFLLRLLFTRLGLNDPAHCHQLRYFHQASLPMIGQEAGSLDYLGVLWSQGLAKAERGEQWQDAVVQGVTSISTTSSRPLPNADRLIAVYDALFPTTEVYRVALTKLQGREPWRFHWALKMVMWLTKRYHGRSLSAQPLYIRGLPVRTAVRSGLCRNDGGSAVSLIPSQRYKRFDG